MLPVDSVPALSNCPGMPVLGDNGFLDSLYLFHLEIIEHADLEMAVSHPSLQDPLDFLVDPRVLHVPLGQRWNSCVHQLVC